MKQKILSEEDKKVWDEFSKGLKKISKDSVEGSQSKSTLGVLSKYNIENKKSDQKINSSSDIKDKISYQLLNEKVIDKRKLRELKRGKIRPEATLDLHGFRRNEAYELVDNFLDYSVKKNFRIVLIITGKGNKSQNHEKKGILRKELPNWISNSNRSSNILALFPASINHGGSGAFYVCLRKKNL